MRPFNSLIIVSRYLRTAYLLSSQVGNMHVSDSFLSLLSRFGNFSKFRQKNLLFGKYYIHV